MIIKAILVLGLCGFAAAFLVTLAKLQEEKERRWDETSIALTIEKELEQSKAREKFSADAVMWYAEMLIDTIRERDDLQDRLSDLLCPHNDHVWKDGRCVKCGRVQDD